MRPAEKNRGDASAAACMLKQEGHELIDAMCTLGFDRNKIYLKLGRRMGSPMRAHFSQTNDVATLNRMVRHLREMLFLARRPQGWHAMRHDGTEYSKMFTDKAVLREVGRRNTLRAMSPLRRFLAHVRATIFG